VTYMPTLKCALKLAERIILYYDARSKKHQIRSNMFPSLMFTKERCDDDTIIKQLV